jgi:hypothetical protein
MTTSPQDPLKDDDMTTGQPTEGSDTTHGPQDTADADGADGTDAAGGDADGSDGSDADGTDGSDADGTDGTDS